MAQALVQCPAHQRLKGIELQLTSFHCHGDGSVVADHFKADLVHHLGDHGVDLAGHDGRASLARGQLDIAHASLRAGRQQAQVIADLGQLDGNALQDARDVGKGTGIASGGNQVAGLDDRHARDFGQRLGHGISVAHRRIDAGANGGAAHVHFAHQIGRFTQTLLIVSDHCGKCCEFLTQSHRHGVL